MRSLNIADLFCGAGGSSEGAEEAIEMLGYKPRLTAVNHWNRAVETYLLNHPEVDPARVKCTGVDNVNPRELFAEDELDVLLASPECTHHSVAAGGRPVNEQSRATAMCVIRWAEALRPKLIWIENVPEFRSWGPLIRKRIDGQLGWYPDPKRKGELFDAFIVMLRATGMLVDYRVVCCADMGDPTTRKRLFIQAVRPPRKIVWPNPTHAEAPGDMFDKLSPWRTARNSVIDWSLQGDWVHKRKKPLSTKTMNRLYAGFKKYGLRPYIVPQNGSNGPRSVDVPAPTVTTTSRGVGLCNAYLVNMKGQSNGADIDKPAPAVTAHAPHLAIAQPYIVPNFGERDGQDPRTHSVDGPLPAVTSRGAGNLIEPFLVKLRGTNDGADVDKPAPTLTGGGTHLALAEPFLVQTSHGDDEGDKKASDRRTRPVDAPLPTVNGNRGDWALCEAALLPQGGGGVLRSVDKPTPTVATDGAIALVEPYLIKFYGTGTAADVDRPLDTVTAKDRFALCQPQVEINGARYVVWFRFRMLQPHELQLAQGFKKDYQFVGNKSETVKMIGNAVPRRTMRALVLASWTQNPDITKYLVEETKEEVA